MEKEANIFLYFPLNGLLTNVLRDPFIDKQLNLVEVGLTA